MNPLDQFLGGDFNSLFAGFIDHGILTDQLVQRILSDSQLFNNLAWLAVQVVHLVVSIVNPPVMPAEFLG